MGVHAWLAMSYLLVSPSGALHKLGEREIGRFCMNNDLNNSNVRTLLEVGGGTNNLSAGKQKAHEANWVPVREVKWLLHGSASDPIFTVGPTRGRGAGEWFLDYIGRSRFGMKFSHSEFKKLLIGQRDELDGWRLVPAPADAEARLRRGYEVRAQPE